MPSHHVGRAQQLHPVHWETVAARQHTGRRQHSAHVHTSTQHLQAQWFSSCSTATHAKHMHSSGVAVSRQYSHAWHATVSQAHSTRHARLPLTCEKCLRPNQGAVAWRTRAADLPSSLSLLHIPMRARLKTRVATRHGHTAKRAAMRGILAKGSQRRLGWAPSPTPISHSARTLAARTWLQTLAHRHFRTGLSAAGSHYYR
jgi:hypothetical protein|mmetsp:Transcript_17567/g.40246  ORF Transcript_17567/g.40246 Transcript_17567/m.40246 type:complete len:201 (+) Transcript_17567:289-891(+)